MRRHLSIGGRVLLGLVFLLGFLLPMFWHREAEKVTKVLPHGPSKTAFVKEVAPLAQELGQAYGIKPSVLIGQAALETNYGNHLLGGRYRNLYSLKANAHQDKVVLQTQELAKNKWVWVKVPYRVYPTYRASMLDYLERLKNKELGKEKLYQNLLAAKTYKEASTALVLGGYTTDEDYADKLVQLIEEQDLTQYDKK